MKFEDLVKRSRKEGEETYKGVLLSLDPGHTTGYAVFKDLALIECDQIATKPDHDGESLRALTDLIVTHSPDEIVFEDYRIYKHRAQHHANSAVHTVRVIGMIQTLALQNGTEYHKQSASVAKAFAGNPQLEEWGFYIPGKRHAMDAVRHGCYFIAMGAPKTKRPGKTMTVG